MVGLTTPRRSPSPSTAASDRKPSRIYQTIRLHDLRHTWATLALEAGVDVAVVSKRLGHSSPVVTWQTYQHVRQGMQTDAAERVAGLIFGA